MYFRFSRYIKFSAFDLVENAKNLDETSSLFLKDFFVKVGKLKNYNSRIFVIY